MLTSAYHIFRPEPTEERQSKSLIFIISSISPIPFESYQSHYFAPRPETTLDGILLHVRRARDGVSGLGGSGLCASGADQRGAQSHGQASRLRLGRRVAQEETQIQSLLQSALTTR